MPVHNFIEQPGHIRVVASTCYRLTGRFFPRKDNLRTPKKSRTEHDICHRAQDHIPGMLLGIRTSNAFHALKTCMVSF